jgi:hypothetical protein
MSTLPESDGLKWTLSLPEAFLPGKKPRSMKWWRKMHLPSIIPLVELLERNSRCVSFPASAWCWSRSRW